MYVLADVGAPLGAHGDELDEEGNAVEFEELIDRAPVGPVWQALQQQLYVVLYHLRGKLGRLSATQHKALQAAAHKHT